ncbi:hypothetical protein Vretimale_8507 [Volvox reticuliferus]|uniref:Protein kinase domain-containing protein n=1 Tax=Volvox reticuliferus TaxID=1737510 RepID=A0A8J4GAW4_9CHLO|nr:hypothetical protein Vretifemale_11663 [Volvox reticuliferus]GIM03814.1 hypothetical protein Vretimale_8507 [Volvox reticuliferus]
MTRPRYVCGMWCPHKRIGSGTFGEVWLAECAMKPGILAVVKVIDFDTDDEAADIAQEVKALMCLRWQQNVVNTWQYSMHDDSAYIVMEYCRGGDLHEYISRRGALHEEQIRHIMSQLAEGMKALRARNIAHRDLKPSNILLCGTRHDEYPAVKIADLGQACALDAAYGSNHLSPDQEPHGPATRRCGSPPFAAPETEFDPYWAECDLWSIGMILYIMLLGRDPYLGDTYSELMYGVKTEKIELPDHVLEEITPGCRNLLYGLLQLDPAKRLTFDQFFDHPFFQGREASAAMMDVDGGYDGTVDVTAAAEHDDSTYSGCDDMIAAATDNYDDDNDETDKTTATTFGNDDDDDSNGTLTGASAASDGTIVAIATCAAATTTAADGDNTVATAVSFSAAANRGDTVLAAATALGPDDNNGGVVSNISYAAPGAAASKVYSICCCSSNSNSSAGSTSGGGVREELISRVATELHLPHGLLKGLEAWASQAPRYGCEAVRSLRLSTATAAVNCCLWLHRMGLTLMSDSRLAGTAQSPPCRELSRQVSDLVATLVLHSWSVLIELYWHLYDTAAAAIDLESAAATTLHHHTIMCIAGAMVDFAVHQCRIATDVDLLRGSACAAEEYRKEANVLLFDKSLPSAAAVAVAARQEHHLHPQSTACGQEWKVPTAAVHPSPVQQSYRSRIAVLSADMRLRQSVLNPRAMRPVAAAAVLPSLEVTPPPVSGAVPGGVPAQGQLRNSPSYGRTWWQWACACIKTMAYDPWVVLVD